MKTPILHSAIIAGLLAASGAWAQQATGANTAPGADHAAQPAAPMPDKEPMQAQELARLVPRDSAQPKAVDISRTNPNSHYRYDKRGVNCTLYPARCRDGDNVKSGG